jgi:Protein of unknown function (DUF2924)
VARPKITSVDASAVEAEVGRIGAMNKAELRSVWRIKYKSDPPRAFGPDLLRRSLAYRLQEEAFGGLPARTKRELDHLIALLNKKPTSRIELPRRIKPGAVLIREWRDKVVRVTVVENGFLFEGKTFSSLSEIALLVTGTKWNGPRFFGLRSPPRADAPTPAADNRSEANPAVGQRRRGRPRRDHLRGPDLPNQDAAS